ncbi:MAG: DUF3037 domain-containing protein [Pedobacter sp.]|nr:MAG: DUF3037 domain-containing protein [Pedobacter sp.]
MSKRHLFEYAVIRVVPRVEREEFLNVGVVVYCRDLKFLSALIHVDEKRLNGFCPSIECEELKLNLAAYKKISEGGKNAGPIGLLDSASRFRWLTAQRSTTVQSSKVHPGMCHDPEKELTKLFEQLVL